MNKKKTKTQSGITLVALIITIIVLLILAIVSIRAIQQGGILTKAQNAVNIYSESEEKERINLAANEALIAGTGTIQEEKLSEALTNQFKDDWEFGTNTNEYFEVKIKSTQRTYKIYTNGKIEKKEPTGGNPGTSEQSDFTYTEGIITGLSEKGLAKLNAGQTEWTIPNKIGEDSITAVGYGAFSAIDMQTYQPTDYSKITGIQLESGIQTIAEYAFFGTSIQTITIPEGVTTIGTVAFGSCVSLEEMLLPSTITSMGGIDFDNFDSCTNLTTIRINQTAEEIKNIEAINTIKDYTQILDKDGNVVTVK